MSNKQLSRHRWFISGFVLLLPFCLSVVHSLSAPLSISSSFQAVQEAVNYKLYKLYIYYDERYPNAWLSRETSSALLRYMKRVLESFCIDYEVVDADELKDVVLNEDPSRSIVIFLQDVVPDTVWDGSSSSPIVRWLRGGAKIVWTGDWEFYYIGRRDGTLVHKEGIEHKPFGRPVTVAVKANISASQIGSRYIPSLEADGFQTLRPFSEKLLRGFEYEVYGYAYVNGNKVIDPGMVKVGNGYFVKIGAVGVYYDRWCCKNCSFLCEMNRAVYITEFVLNRFYGLAVDLTNGLSLFHPYDSGIVYILPHGASTPYWNMVFGDRIYFYAYSNITHYREYILSDLEVIAQKYRFIILILPLEDTDLFYYNLRQMDAWAAEKKLRILYSFFPKWKYGPEEDYLKVGSTKYNLMVKNMRFLTNLTSTLAIAIWYGWSHKLMNVEEIRCFYYSLPESLRRKYYVWIDEPFIEEAVEAGLANLANELDLTVVTELYSPLKLALYGAVFKRQIVVTGLCNIRTSDEWSALMRKKLSYILASTDNSLQYRRLGVWIYWDENDGSNEKYRAYIGNNLSNPLLANLPSHVLMDKAEPIEARVNLGSTQIVRLHFSWPNGLAASNIEVILNGTSYMTDENGWISLRVMSRNVRKQTWIPVAARWDFHSLEVKVTASTPSIIWDMVVIELRAERSRVDVGGEAKIEASGFYLYDRKPFKGSYLLNDSLVKDVVGKYCYRVSGIEDEEYGLTAFSSNEVCVIFDRISVIDSGSLEKLVDIGSSTIVWFKAIYEYDGSIFDSSKGVLYVNGSAASWNNVEARWEILTEACYEPAKKIYVVTGVRDEAHGITVVNDVAGPVVVEWVRAQPKKDVLVCTLLAVVIAASILILWKRKFNRR